ncbi:hypothetical protein [Variovorax paradoxus]|uniref:hypothetical protein n=1 Tax=Variovorax paradoxus TaxID=34073 RepID=UPI003AAC6665
MRCGPFSEHRPMALFDRPTSCPTCAAESDRMLSIPVAAGQRRSGEQSRQSAAHSDGSNYQRLRKDGVCACCP